MSKYSNALEYVKAFMDQNKTIEYGDNELLITVNDNVNIDDVYNAITTIVDNVVEREFEYELIDLMIPYYLMKLFTDITPPMVEENGETYPDFQKCYEIAICLNLEYELTQVSPLVAGYIYMLTQNIWRRLDYHKSHGAYLKQELMESLSAFYEIMDELDKVAEQQNDIDLDGFMKQLNDISQSLQDFKNEQNNPTVSIIDDKTSVDLAIPESN